MKKSLPGSYSQGFHRWLGRWPKWVEVGVRAAVIAVLVAASALTPALTQQATAVEVTGTDDVPLIEFLDLGSCTDPNLGVTAAGLGLFQSTKAGNLSVTLPAGATPDGAYLFWNGAETSGNQDGDPQVVFNGNNVTAGQSYGGALWGADTLWPNYYYAWSYRAAVSYAGSGVFPLSGVGVPPGGDLDLYNNGAGLLALYRDPALGAQRVQLAHGLDLMQGRTGPLSGAGSGKLAFAFAPEPHSRSASLISLVGGAFTSQQSKLWYLTGSGPLPTTDLYTIPGAVQIANPFQASNGLRWDTFQATATIPANSQWIVIQLESIASNPNDLTTAPRLEWIAQSFALPLDCPDLGNQTFVDWNNNGVYEPSIDQPFPTNMTVSLTGSTGYNATTTALGGVDQGAPGDADGGNYLFADLPAPASYTASVPAQSGYTPTTPLTQVRSVVYPGPDVLDVDFGFLPQPGIAVTKLAGAVGDGEILYLPAPGSVTYTYVVTNTGGTYLTQVTVTDDKLGAICVVAGPLAPGASTTCTKTVTVSTDTTNIGTATGTPAQPNGSPIPSGVVTLQPPTDTDNAVVVIRQAAVQIVKLAGNAPDGGTWYVNGSGPVTYTYIVTNVGTVYLVNVTVTDDKLGQICVIPGPLAPGASDTCTKTTTVTADTTNIGCVTGTPSDPNGKPFPPGTPPITPPTDCDDAVVDSVRPAIDIVKLAGNAPDGTVLYLNAPGQVLYTYRVTNTGDTYLANVLVTDNRLSPPPICTIALLAPGASQTCTTTAFVSADVTNIGRVTADPTTSQGTPLPGVSQVADEDNAVVDLVSPAITIEKTVSLTGQCPGQNTVEVIAGTQVTYCYRVTNTGDTYLATISVSDNLLGSICTIALLAPGASQNCTKTATIDRDTTNVGTATGTPSNGQGTPLPGLPPVTDQDDATVDVVTPGLTLEKTVSLNGQCPGQNMVVVDAGTVVTYCYKVTNTGGNYLANIAVTDNVLGNVCTIALLAPGAAQTCTKTATVNQDTTNIGTAIGTPSDSQGNPLPGAPPVRDDDDAVVDVVRPALTIDKTVSLTGQCPGQNSVTVAVGAQVTYCYVVTNTGDTYLADVTVTDNLLGAICTIPLMGPRAVQTCTKAATISQATVNVGAATGTPADGQGNPYPGVDKPTDEDDATVQVVRPSVVIDKTVSLNGLCPGVNSVVVAPNTQVTYCYRVTNSGNTYLSNLVVSDNILGGICTIALLAPGASQNCTKTATITQSVVNTGTVNGTPADSQGTPLPNVPPVSDDDDASVSLEGDVGSIGDLVWHDLNVDGYWNAGEPGIPGVQVCLYPDDGDGVLEPSEIAARIGCQTTNANGNYTFVGLPAGNYLVDIDASNFQPGGPLVGMNLTSRFKLGPDPMPVSLDPGENFVNADFGYARADINLDKTVSIDGRCPGFDQVSILPGQEVTYCYTVTNTGETYLSNVIVTDDKLGVICQVPVDLAPGESYSCSKKAVINADVCNVGTATGNPVDSKGNDLTEFPDADDTDGACVDVVAPAIRIIKTVTTGATCPGVDLLQVSSGTLVKYCYEVTNTGDTYLTEVLVTDDKLGFICFLPGVLAPGASMTCSTTAVISVDTVNVGSVSGNPSTPGGEPLPNMPNVTDDDDAHVVPLGALGDYVWNDADNDGLQDPLESGIANVLVCLYTDVNKDGVYTAGVDTPVTGAGTLPAPNSHCVYTDANGKYLFDDLPGGDYVVDIDDANFSQSKPLYQCPASPRFQGSDPMIDSNGHPVTHDAGWVLAAGQVYLGVDFGFDCTPTPAQLVSTYTYVRELNGRVQVHWATSNEIDIVGFNVLRGQYLDVRLATRVNAAVIPAEGMSGQDVTFYRLDDKALEPDAEYYVYWIEVVEADGSLSYPSLPLKVVLTGQRTLFVPFVTK